jgi:hypothetical protein
LRYYNARYGTNTPRVYLNGIGVTRSYINDKLGSDALSSLENKIIAKTLRDDPNRDRLNVMIEDMEVTPIVRSTQVSRKLGADGCAEVLAKLGMFLSLMQEDEIFTRRKK